MSAPKLILEISPDEVFFPNVRRRFTCHLNPDVITDGTIANYADISPSGSNLSLGQFVSSDENPINFSIILNEYGADEDDYSVRLGHMNVRDSLRWLSLAQKAVASKNKKVAFGRPPVLLLMIGLQPIVPVTLRLANKSREYFDSKTLATIRCSVDLSFRVFRKIFI